MSGGQAALPRGPGGVSSERHEARAGLPGHVSQHRGAGHSPRHVSRGARLLLHLGPGLSRGRERWQQQLATQLMEYSKNDTRPTLAAIRKRLGEETIYENLRQTEIRSTKLDRTNSTVHRVSNLMRWPRNKFKQQEKKFL